MDSPEQNRSDRQPDPACIRALAELMEQHDLSRLEWRDGQCRLLLRRGQPVVAAPAAALHFPPVAAAPSVGVPAPAQAAPAAPSASPGVEETYIRSPMVGTFYAAAEPGAPPFASPGDVVTPERVVCLIEAMKVFNEIRAEVSGRITRVLVKNGQAVEYDQPLFAVAPA